MKKSREELIKLIDVALKMKVSEAGYEGLDLGDTEITLKNGDTIIFAEYEETPWEDEGKFQYQEQIFEAVLLENGDWNSKTNKLLDLFYKQHTTRSGSYFSHYEFSYEHCGRVVLNVYEKTVEVRDWNSA